MAFRFVPSIEEMERLRIAVLMFVEIVEGTFARESHPDNSDALRAMRFQEVIEGLQAIDLVLNPDRLPFEHPERNATRTQGWTAPGFRALIHLKELFTAALQACKCESICNDQYGGFDIGGNGGIRYMGDDPKLLERCEKFRKRLTIVPKGWSPRIPDYIVDGIKQCAESLALAMRNVDDPETAKRWPIMSSVGLGPAIQAPISTTETIPLPEFGSADGRRHSPQNRVSGSGPPPECLTGANPAQTSAPPDSRAAAPVLNESTFSVHWNGRTCELGNSPRFRLMKELVSTPNCYTTFEKLAERMGDDSDGIYHVKSRLIANLRNANMGDLAALIRTADGHYGLFIEPGANQKAT